MSHVVVLLHRQGMSLRDISRKLDISRERVRQIVAASEVPAVLGDEEHPQS